MFAIWLAPVELIAIDSDQRLVLVSPAAAADWTHARFSQLIAATAAELGCCDIRFASPAERRVFDTCAAAHPTEVNPKEAAG